MIERRILGALAVLSTAGVAYACGGRTASGASTPEDPAAECGAYYDAIQTFSACGSAPMSSGDESSRASFVSTCVDRNALPGSRYAAGLQACADALSGWPCNALGLPLDCENVMAGTLPAGAPCSDLFQCASSVCTGDPFVDDGGIETVTCGTCEPVASPGGPCFTGTIGLCGEGEVCGALDTCEPPPSGDIGSSCVLFPCNVGLACSSTSNTCVMASPLGGSCNDKSDCAPNLVCISATCASPLTVGEACGGQDECAPSLACDSTGHCAPTSWSTGGAPCDATHICRIGACSVTDGGAGTCPTIGGVGAPCTDTLTSTAVCASGLYCGGGVCMNPPTRPTCN